MKNKKIKEVLSVQEQEKVLLHFLATNQEQLLLRYLRAGFTVTGPVALLICNLSKYDLIVPIKHFDETAGEVFRLYFDSWDNNVIDKCFAYNNFALAYAINSDETCSRLIIKENWQALMDLGEDDQIPEQEKLKLVKN